MKLYLSISPAAAAKATGPAWVSSTHHTPRPDAPTLHAPTLHPLTLSLGLCAGFLLLADSAPAQSWQTVDDFQYVAGRQAENEGLVVAPNGTLYACGVA